MPEVQVTQDPMAVLAIVVLIAVVAVVAVVAAFRLARVPDVPRPPEPTNVAPTATEPPAQIALPAPTPADLDETPR